MGDRAFLDVIMVSLGAEHATRPKECRVRNGGRVRRCRVIDPGSTRSSRRRDRVLEYSRVLESSLALKSGQVLVGSRV
jgi:hypothetical protein